MVKMADNVLNVSEIFGSISGEVGGFPQGTWCTFIRLAGCNLNCDYCDAPETQIRKPDQQMDLLTILDRVQEKNRKSVVITGGEPLLQDIQTLGALIQILNEDGFIISIETNGTYRIPIDILKRSTIVMDYKLHYIERMKSVHFLDLKPTDFVKFIISSDIDMALALSIQRKLYQGGCVAQFAYSPMLCSNGSTMLVELKKRTDIILNGLSRTTMAGILNIQIHKLIDQP